MILNGFVYNKELPRIRVTAKAGVLLNLHFKGSSIILESYQLKEEETQHTFIVDMNDTAYVIDDVTNGLSVEKLVASVATHDVMIPYTLYFIKNGKLVNGVSYSVEHNNYSSEQSGSVTTNPFKISRKGASFTKATFSPSFSSSYYTKAVATITSGYTNDEDSLVYIGVGSTESYIKFGPSSIPSIITRSIKITSSQQLWLKLTSWSSGTNPNITFGDVWLE